MEVLGEVEFEVDFARIQVTTVRKRTTRLLKNIMKFVGNDRVRNGKKDVEERRWRSREFEVEGRQAGSSASGPRPSVGRGYTKSR